MAPRGEHPVVVCRRWPPALEDPSDVVSRQVLRTSVGIFNGGSARR